MNPSREVPGFGVRELFPRASEYAVCVFVINEGDKVRKQLLEMAALRGVDIIVCDGGSTDGSLDSWLLGEARVRALLTKTGPGKLSAQMRMGFSWCLDQGYKGIVTIDGNGKDDFRAVPRFVEALQAGYDHVQGSRYVPGGRHENTPLSRHVAVRLLHAPLISLSAGFRYTDTTNGFRGYSAGFLLDPRVQPFRSVFSGYELHYYLAIRAARLGFACLELPVTRVYPKHGKVPTKISPVRGNLLVLQTLFRAVFHRYDPK